MANSLLDFVMSLVRDPDAAARYAADPAGAIADAHLTDVTSADVSNLIPMVADSLSGPVSGGGFGPGPAAGDGNVWASGAATAAFDAFDHLPAAVTAPEVHSVITEVAQHADQAPSLITDLGVDPGALDLPGAAAQVTDTVLDHGVSPDAGHDWADPAAWDHSHAADDHGVDHSGFDLF
ncbi:IniB N-terminal domain-containing protein [Mycobacterium sp. EPa45]|uniref:Rv0340 family IniB-related protein n=1 Tax=Mycobacterium sp. EPa45 TaxID=1545728 RepID=UPI0006422BB9|nr:IniB N-terminal domain-containing protein [Mycobacterium sp. EPa45]AKK25792.1 hypothetical protein AB431_02685 [Mycobacterium sp. EPa45]